MVSEKIIGEGQKWATERRNRSCRPIKMDGLGENGDREKNSMAPPTGKEKNLGEGAKEGEGSHEVSVSPIYSG